MADGEGEKSGWTLRELLGVGSGERVDWAAVQERLQSHPDEAAERDNNALYPLFFALSRAPPPAIVRALLDAHTGAAAAKSEDGWTPLHAAIACSCGAEVVGMVLEAFPEAANKKDRLSLIPLHYALDREDAEVVRLLLRAHPECVGVKDARGRLPLHWAAMSENATPAIVRLLLDEGIRQGVEGGSGGANVKNKGKTPLDRACERIAERGISNESWEVVVLLARAATSSTAGVMDDGSVNVTPLLDRAMLPVLHAVVKAGCPKQIIRHAISIGNPGAGLMRDHRGRTALAVAASMSEPDPDVIEALLSDGSGAEAAKMADTDGRLPLHTATEAGWEFGGRLDILCRHAPWALATRDMKTHFYPFMLAAVGPKSSVDSIFQLLRANPTLARGMAEGQHWEESKLKLQTEVRQVKKEIS